MTKIVNLGRRSQVLLVYGLSNCSTHQHERVGEYNAIQLNDVLVVERCHGVDLLDELLLVLLSVVQHFDCHGNLGEGGKAIKQV